MFGQIMPSAPCPTCGAKPGDDHNAGCVTLHNMRAAAYPECLDNNGRRSWQNAIEKRDARIAELERALREAGK